MTQYGRVFAPTVSVQTLGADPAPWTATDRVLEFLDALATQAGTSDPVVATLVATDGRVLTLRAADISQAVNAPH